MVVILHKGFWFISDKLNVLLKYSGTEKNVLKLSVHYVNCDLTFQKNMGHLLWFMTNIEPWICNDGVTLFLHLILRLNYRFVYRDVVLVYCCIFVVVQRFSMSCLYYGDNLNILDCGNKKPICVINIWIVF